MLRNTTSLPIYLILIALIQSLAALATVETTSGAVEGFSVSETTAYLGIPYAQPPIGARRFRPPVPAARWEGVLQATRAGNLCLQPTFSSSTGSEDCLTLNIWVPQNAKGPLPVMVFFHGGGLISGSGTDEGTEGSLLAARGKVIVATLNYRLGALGFLAHPALSAETEYRGSGNYGLMDQALAYQWIVANAARFGGDATRITIFGQSSGATSVCGLITSPLTRSLVQRAILQSQWCQARDLSEAESKGAQLVKSTSCSQNPTAACLRALPATELLKVPMTRMLDKDNFRFTTMSLTVDGYALLEKPLDAFAKGRAADIPMIIGSTAQDGFGLAPLIIRSHEVMGSLDLFGMVGSRQVQNMYRPADHAWNENFRASAIINDMVYQCPVRALGRLRSRIYTAPTFMYVFDQGFPIHGSELSYLFQKTTKPADAHLTALMLSLWTAFARGESPLAHNAAWPATENSADTWLRISDTPVIDHNHRREYCDLFDSLVGGSPSSASK